MAGQRVEPLPVQRMGAILCDDGSIAWRGVESAELLPEDFVLRELFDVDVDDPEAVVAVVNDYGMVARQASTRSDALAAGITYRDESGTEHAGV